MAMAGEKSVSGVPTLTATDRDSWFAVREELQNHETSAASLERIERAMFMVCLDDSSPETATEVGRTTLNAAQNRWYDKTLQFVVFANGKASFIGEHAKSDGSPTARLCDELLTRLANGVTDLDTPALPGNALADAVTPLNFHTSTTVADAVDKAESYVVCTYQCSTMFGVFVAALT